MLQLLCKCQTQTNRLQKLRQGAGNNKKKKKRNKEDRKKKKKKNGGDSGGGGKAVGHKGRNGSDGSIRSRDDHDGDGEGDWKEGGLDLTDITPPPEKRGRRKGNFSSSSAREEGDDEDDGGERTTTRFPDTVSLDDVAEKGGEKDDESSDDPWGHVPTMTSSSDFSSVRWDDINKNGGGGGGPGNSTAEKSGRRVRRRDSSSRSSGSSIGMGHRWSGKKKNNGGDTGGGGDGSGRFGEDSDKENAREGGGGGGGGGGGKKKLSRTGFALVEKEKNAAVISPSEAAVEETPSDESPPSPTRTPTSTSAAAVVKLSPSQERVTKELDDYIVGKHKTRNIRDDINNEEATTPSGRIGSSPPSSPLPKPSILSFMGAMEYGVQASPKSPPKVSRGDVDGVAEPTVENDDDRDDGLVAMSSPSYSENNDERNAPAPLSPVPEDDGGGGGGAAGTNSSSPYLSPPRTKKKGHRHHHPVVLSTQSSGDMTILKPVLIRGASSGEDGMEVTLSPLRTTAMTRQSPSPTKRRSVGGGGGRTRSEADDPGGYGGGATAVLIGDDVEEIPSPKRAKKSGSTSLTTANGEDECSSDDGGRGLVRYDGWHAFRGGGGRGKPPPRLPFVILGTSADDVEAQPHVLSPLLMESLRSFLPMACSEDNFCLKYSLARDGASYEALLSRVRWSQRTILTIETDDGEVLGSFTSSPWKVQPNFYGTGESFLWRLKKSRMVERRLLRKEQKQKQFQLRVDSEIELYPFTRFNNDVQRCTSDRLVVGGGTWSPGENPYPDELSGFGLVIDEYLERGSSSTCSTFANPGLSRLHANGEQFRILNLEVWTLTPFATLDEAEKFEQRKRFLEEQTVR